VLRQLHLLPVRQRIEFKLAVLVYKAMSDDVSTILFWWTTASLPLLPVDDDYTIVQRRHVRVRFQELAQVWAIAHSLLL